MNAVWSGPDINTQTKIAQLELFDRLHHLFETKQLKPNMLSYYLFKTSEYRSNLRKYLIAIQPNKKWIIFNLK